MKKTKTLATIIAVTHMGSALCHAQAADPKKKQFDKIDADKNGSISLEEMKAASKDPAKAEKNFARIDTDKNGAVSPEEFNASKAKKPKKPKAKKPAAPAAE
jgi:Ca2+-binding EF-hand superfamily protein